MICVGIIIYRNASMICSKKMKDAPPPFIPPQTFFQAHRYHEKPLSQRISFLSASVIIHGDIFISSKIGGVVQNTLTAYIRG